MEIAATPIPGCFELRPDPFEDARGRFVKVFQDALHRARGLAVAFAEQYYSYSEHGVLRGMHFQLPPHEHAKMVHCLEGEVLDAVVDLRRGSPAYGRAWSGRLSGERVNGLYIPAGLAHGFYVTGSRALLDYRVTSAHAPDHDAGVRWDTVGVDWPAADPVLSDRDRAHPALADFESPFRYEP